MIFLNICRIYVCKTLFGESRDTCLEFKNIDDYDKWVRENPDQIGLTSFQPICNKIDIFDKMILAYRNGKIMPPIIDNRKKTLPE